MRAIIRGTLVAALVAMTHTPSALAAEPEAKRCGEGRTWWAPLEACVTLPVLTKTVEPDYGEDTPPLRYGAILFVKVSAAGTVADVQVLRAPPEGEPTKEGELALGALLKAVRQWRFSPGLGPDGKPVAMTVTLKVQLMGDDEERE